MLFFLFAMSCATNPPLVETPPGPPLVTAEIPVVQPEAAKPEPVPEPPLPVEPEQTPAEPVFNPETISQEQFDTTKADIQEFVENLNRIIRVGNYTSWLTHLSEDYRNLINTKAFLDDLKARYPVYRNRINNAKDYFTYVVVPSRANDHVDDIEFISENEVTAYTLGREGQRLILYDLENINGSWKITH